MTILVLNRGRYTTRVLLHMRLECVLSGRLGQLLHIPWRIVLWTDKDIVDKRDIRAVDVYVLLGQRVKLRYQNVAMPSQVALEPPLSPECNDMFIDRPYINA